MPGLGSARVKNSNGLELPNPQIFGPGLAQQKNMHRPRFGWARFFQLKLCWAEPAVGSSQLELARANSRLSPAQLELKKPGSTKPRPVHIFLLGQSRAKNLRVGQFQAIWIFDPGRAKAWHRPNQTLSTCFLFNYHSIGTYISNNNENGQTKGNNYT